jgi:methylated-DNA-[protein]-cysteine S-methyltransferase
MLHYTVFRTRWGYFGLAGTEEAVCRTFLPVSEREKAEQGLLRSFQSAGDNLRLNKGFRQDLQERIIAYYEGEPVDFAVEPAVNLNGAGPFVHHVLDACRSVAFGRTTTYSDLARQIGRPNAARAVGGVMAGNPIPLIIPCHRVLRTDGGLGGFSAPGGTATKQEMLRHEQAVAYSIVQTKEAAETNA